MINSEVIKKIEDFVYAKPRSVQEIAGHIEKNWRTADRYIEEIEKNFGTISTRVFREGTRGALKIVFWASVDKISHSIFQEKLEQDILKAKRKEDFSAFDIFQYVDANKKKVEVDYEESTNIPELSRIMLGAEKQILIFSGNLSFINLNNKKMDMFETFEKLILKGIPIKIVCRVDIAGKENIERMLSLNFKYGKEAIEIRHCENPFRAVIVDNKLLRIKEVSEPTGKIKELNKKLFLYYTIKDKEWAEWASKIFWKIFSSSLSANKRLEEIKKIPYSFK
ncbi:MAG: hypothetical protein Q8L29_04080 [archaeon]|nr:hypothetical protein [archaeon]